MSLTTSEMSPADLRAVMGNNDDGFGFGGNGAWWIIILLLFGWGRGGFGGFGGNYGGGQGGYGYPCFGTPATQADLSAAFASNSVLSGINGIDSTLCQGFNGINTAILQNGYNTQAGINTLSHQLADCCCATQRAIDSVKYENAANTCALQNTINNTTRDIIENANANSRAVLDFLVNDKISTLAAENQALKFQASQSAQNAFITANQEAQTAELIRRLGRDCPVPAYVVPNPNCCYQYAQPTCGCGGSF
jgi:hypothetical protein